MLFRLQKKTLIPAQIVGYAITLLVGVVIVILAVQLYFDVRPLLTQQTDVFKAQTVTVSKKVNLAKTVNKKGIYFAPDELESLQEQPFVKNVARFTSANFSTSASIELGNGLPGMSTDLFFESVPDGYLDVQSDQWHWDLASDFVPVVIPEDYLNLYNFGFAESQSLPVISQSTIEHITFSIHVAGNGKRQSFDGRIVGFSNKINSILVPEDFLLWANTEFGPSEDKGSSRLLVEFADASDERIPAFFEEVGYDINQKELESGKMVFLFRFALLFVIAIAAVIILLSLAFIVMSLNLIIQKNRELFINLYNIGYSPSQMAHFYQLVVSIITLIDILVAAIVALNIRVLYVERLSSMFDIEGGTGSLWLTASALLFLLLSVYNILVRRSIRLSVVPK